MGTVICCERQDKDVVRKLANSDVDTATEYVDTKPTLPSNHIQLQSNSNTELIKNNLKPTSLPNAMQDMTKLQSYSSISETERNVITQNIENESKNVDNNSTIHRMILSEPIETNPDQNVENKSKTIDIKPIIESKLSISKPDSDQCTNINENHIKNDSMEPIQLKPVLLIKVPSIEIKVDTIDEDYIENDEKRDEVDAKFNQILQSVNTEKKSLHYNPLTPTASMDYDAINFDSILSKSKESKERISIAITTNYFASAIMKKIEHGNNLNLSKIQMKKSKIGRGTSALVHLATYNNREIALKEYKFNDKDFNDAHLAEFENELNIYKHLDHVNVIKLFGYHLNVYKKVLKFAFEYCANGSLFDLIHPLFTTSTYEYKDIINMLLDIAKGMEYIHSKKIINRDLKPKNLLLFDDYHVKLTDFGESVLVDCDKDEDCDFEDYKLFESVGTNGYKAPEIISIDEEGYNYKIDVFSFGSICYELWTKKFVSGIQYLTKFQHLKQDAHLELVSSDSHENFQDLIILCWQFKAENRPPFAAIVEMLNECVDD